MKKSLITALALVLTASLFTGCAGQENSSDNSAENSTSSESIESENNSTESTQNNPAESTENSENSVSPETQAQIDAFALDNITAPDGSTLSKSDAVWAQASQGGDTYAIGFDFSFMRYAKQIYNTTFQNPGLVNWETLEFNTDAGFVVDNPEYFKVTAGDKLANGLTVTSANFWVNSAGEMLSSEIVLDGEMTLEGVLYCYPETADYIDVAGDLVFFADTVKNEFVPVPPMNVCFIEQWTDPAYECGIVYDGRQISFGNIAESSVDLSNLFTNSSYANVKVTMKNIRVAYRENGGGLVYAELCSAEEVPTNS